MKKLDLIEAKHDCQSGWAVIKLSSLIFLVLLLTGCAAPAQHFASEALHYGFNESTVTTTTFKHRIYANQLANKVKSDAVLHVYLDGDGTPWDRQSWPADDPTSRNPMILSLMAQDKAAAILLGRPCYHGFSTTAACHHSLWTSKRYAPEIVDSMTAALTSWLQKHLFQQIVLIGYSGGGSLAVLIADKIAAVQTVVTFAANLDVAAWSKAQGYENLTESLNPIEQKKLPQRIKQLHFAGGDDGTVPAEVVKAYADSQKNALYQVFPEFDHQCCWEQEWQKILALF
jgi:pimeloyl-ACP methyl ester carboxylesterase